MIGAVARKNGNANEAYSSSSLKPKLFVPLKLATFLDQWCSHQIEKVPGPDGKLELPRIVPDTVLAFGPKDQRFRISIWRR